MSSREGDRSSAESTIRRCGGLRGGLIGFLLGASLSVLLFYLSAFSLGAGHGSGLPFVVFVFPLLYGLAAWPLVGVALGIRTRSAAWCAAAVLVVYLVAVLYHATFTYRHLVNSGGEGEVNVFTLIAAGVWTVALAQAWRVVYRRLRQAED